MALQRLLSSPFAVAYHSPMRIVQLAIFSVLPALTACMPTHTVVINTSTPTPREFGDRPRPVVAALIDRADIKRNDVGDSWILRHIVTEHSSTTRYSYEAYSDPSTTVDTIQSPPPWSRVKPMARHAPPVPANELAPSSFDPRVLK